MQKEKPGLGSVVASFDAVEYPLHRYSTSKTTWVTLLLLILIIFIGNPVVDKHY